MSTIERISNAENSTPEAARACAVIDAKFAEIEMEQKPGDELIVAEGGRQYLNLELTCTSDLINAEHDSDYSTARVLLERPDQEEKQHEPNLGYKIRIREIIDQPGHDGNGEHSRLQTLFAITSDGELMVKRRVDAPVAPGESVDNPKRSDTFALSSGVRLSGAHPDLVAVYKNGLESLFGSSEEEQENFWFGIEGRGVEITDPAIVDEIAALIEGSQPLPYGRAGAASQADVEQGIAAAHQANEVRSKITKIDSKIEDATSEREELAKELIRIRSNPLADLGYGPAYDELHGERHLQLGRDRIEKGKFIKKQTAKRSTLEAKLGKSDTIAENSIGRGTVGDKYLIEQAEKRRKT